jgi:hypothetical protein
MPSDSATLRPKQSPANLRTATVKAKEPGNAALDSAFSAVRLQPKATKAEAIGRLLFLAARSVTTILYCKKQYKRHHAASPYDRNSVVMFQA